MRRTFGSQSPISRRLTSQPNHEETEDTVESIDPEESDTECDFYFCIPKWCQQFRTRRMMLGCLSWCLFTKAMLITGFIQGNLTSLERRYGLTSKESGAIVIFYNLGAILCIIPVCQYGAEKRRLRIVSCGIFIMSIGALLFTVPHYTSGPYKYKSSIEPKCYRGMNTSVIENVCDGTESYQRSYMLLFWFAGLVVGVGCSPLQSLCATYIDDNTKITQTALYVGIWYTSSIMGPFVGFILSAFSLQGIYVDVKSSHPGLTPADKNAWIGAWWIGPLIASAMFLLAVPVLYSFPKQLPGTVRIITQRKSEAFFLTDSLSRTISRSELCANVWLLLKNPTFMFLSVSLIAFDFLISGLATFGPKYVETVFGFSPREAMKVIGLSTIIVGAFGTLIGGVLVYCLKLKLLQTLRFMAVISLVLPPLSILTFLVPCGNKGQHWAGISVRYQNESTETSMSINSSCNMDCRCQTHHLFLKPVCGKDGLTYLSPCFAGCTGTVETLNTYNNCSCITLEDDLGHDPLQLGSCQYECMNTLLFFVLFCVSTLHVFLIYAPSMVATMRTVPAKQKTLALGFQCVVIRVFGSLTGPLLIGSAFDSTCNFWANSCNGVGNCYHYHHTRLRNALVCFVGVGATVLSTSLFLAWIFYKSDEADTADQIGNRIDSPLASISTINSSTLKAVNSIKIGKK